VVTEVDVEIKGREGAQTPIPATQCSHMASEKEKKDNYGEEELLSISATITQDT